MIAMRRYVGALLSALASAHAFGAPILTADLTSQTGPENAVVWGFTVDNPQPFAISNVQFTGLALVQTGGAACTPVVDAAFPVSIGAIAANASGSATATIDFTGCPDAGPPPNPPTPDQAFFDVTATFTGDGGASGSLLLEEVTPYTPGTLISPPPPRLPEPATMLLLIAALLAQAYSGALRSRRAVRRASVRRKHASVER